MKNVKKIELIKKALFKKLIFFFLIKSNDILTLKNRKKIGRKIVSVRKSRK